VRYPGEGARVVEAIAAGLGYLARFVVWLTSIALLFAGPVLIVYGIDLIYRPAAYIAAGLFALWLRLWRSQPIKGGK
jgi:hypothetical protein